MSNTEPTRDADHGARSGFRSGFRYWGGVALAAVLWLGMFCWANIPPYRGNILEQKKGFLVWHWQLYSRAGTGICDVRYFDMNEDGAPIERWKLLGYERPGLMPDHLARTKKRGLFNDYRRVCNAVEKAGDPEPNIRVSARCAEKGAWKQVEHRRRNVCEVVERRRKAKLQKIRAKSRNRNKNESKNQGTTR